MPDLALLPRRHPGVARVSFGAGAGGTLAQAALFAASWCGRIAPLPQAVASALHRLGQAFEAFGPRRSAMFVSLTGRGHDGAPLALCWELVAEDHHGRNIPCLGAVALVRKAARGGLPVAGAGPCVGLLSLDEYLAELDGLPVSVALNRT